MMYVTFPGRSHKRNVLTSPNAGQAEKIELAQATGLDYASAKISHDFSVRFCQFPSVFGRVR
jgi:hypothetical protein